MERGGVTGGTGWVEGAGFVGRAGLAGRGGLWEVDEILVFA